MNKNHPLTRRNFISLIAAATGASFIPQSLSSQTPSAPNYPPAKFLIFSDPHLYLPSLGISGEAFENYLADDRKLLRESEEILEAITKEVIATDVDFVIVCGDLTKDGEEVCHLQVANTLDRIAASGKKIFVVPGNHDINNGEASSYNGTIKTNIQSVSPNQFSEIYKRAGFDDAISRDPHSLSYLAEPVQGLYLLAIDSCRYKENRVGHHPVTGGVVSKPSLIWIEEQLQKTRSEGKGVIGTLHHGLMPHYEGQLKFYPDYVVANAKALQELFLKYDVRFTFTGHFHAQDITSIKKEGKFIYDIETGSLVTWPCPWRVAEFRSDERFQIKSYRLESTKTHPTDFQEYAKNYALKGIKSMATDRLTELGVASKDVDSASTQVAAAFVTHYGGDENPDRVTFDMSGFAFKSKFITSFRKKLIEGLNSDINSPDNDILIDYKTGRLILFQEKQ